MPSLLVRRVAVALLVAVAAAPDQRANYDFCGAGDTRGPACSIQPGDPDVAALQAVYYGRFAVPFWIKGESGFQCPLLPEMACHDSMVCGSNMCSSDVTDPATDCPEVPVYEQLSYPEGFQVGTADPFERTGDGACHGSCQMLGRPTDPVGATAANMGTTGGCFVPAPNIDLAVRALADAPIYYRNPTSAECDFASHSLPCLDRYARPCSHLVRSSPFAKQVQR
jgi:hypothetical protein